MTCLPAYCEMPEKKRRRARKVLEREIGMPIGDTDADALIEQVWNALTGRPLADEE